MSQPTRGLSALREHYDALLCDVWGVLHNGVAVYEAAAHALQQWRASGGQVVMITNSPRPRAGVVAQFGDLGVPEGVFDELITSGDVTRRLISDAAGPIHHLGPDRDINLYEGLGVDLVPLEEAASIACTGLVEDEHENPQDYLARLRYAVERNMPFICANPDIVVERGDRLIWCAGALAQLHSELGGETRFAGKPHDPIYKVAREALNNVADERIICVGDGMPTDVKGANDAGYDLLFIAAGIHGAEYTGADGVVDGTKLDAFFQQHGAGYKAWMKRLEW